MDNVDALFGAIGAALETDASLAEQVNGVVVFDFGPDQWTLYLKGPNLGAKKERSPTSDVSLTLSPADFLAMARKEVTSQSLFLKGRLRLRGNMGLAMKLGKVLEAAAAGTAPTKLAVTATATETTTIAPAAPAPVSDAAPKSSAVFDAIAAGVAREGKALVAKVNAIIRFDIGDGAVSGRTHTYVLDLKTGEGKLHRAGLPYEGPVPDVTISMSDDDFVAMAQGKLNAQSAFLKGQLKIKGQMSQAMKLQSVMEAARAAPAAKL